jgi:hypothetical protein
MSWTNEKVQEAAGKIVERASRDEEFRKLVLADPYAAIKEVTGLEVPREFKLQVVDGSGYHATVVLPEARGAEDELTDTDLEMVSGGSKDGAKDFFEGVGNLIYDSVLAAG